MKKFINERELDQKMFKTIKTLRENVEPQPPVQPSETDIAANQEEFRQTVAMDAKFKEFNILVDAGNVIFNGSIPGICEWEFEYQNREGAQIAIPQQITMTNDVMEMLNKMNGAFENWRNEWSTKLLEYQKDAN